jgi:cytochrome c-type biogenesis protein CcmH/NrfG
LFAVVAAGLLAQSVHSRNPGGALTGNDPAASATVSRTALENAVKSHPNDYNARIALARFMLNRDVKEAVVQYDAAAKLAPKQPEPVTYAGWINALVAGQLKPGDKDRTLLLGRAMERFAHAIDIAPTYADTFVFRGITRMRVIGDMKGAIPDLQRFLQLAPADHPQRELVLGALRQAVASTSQSTSTTVPPTTNP